MNIYIFGQDVVQEYFCPWSNTKLKKYESIWFSCSLSQGHIKLKYRLPGHVCESKLKHILRYSSQWPFLHKVSCIVHALVLRGLLHCWNFTCKQHYEQQVNFRVLLAQFLTNDVIDSRALDKILDVMIDSEMSFPFGEIPRRQSLVTLFLCAIFHFLHSA